MPIFPSKDKCPLGSRICALCYQTKGPEFQEPGFTCVGLRRKMGKRVPLDVIQVCGRNERGKLFVRCVIRPDEALELAMLLLAATTQAFYDREILEEHSKLDVIELEHNPGSIHQIKEPSK